MMPKSGDVVDIASPTQVQGNHGDAALRSASALPLTAARSPKKIAMSKNERLARAAQADETGDAYADEVMNSGAEKALKRAKDKLKQKTPPSGSMGGY